MRLGLNYVDKGRRADDLIAILCSSLAKYILFRTSNCCPEAKLSASYREQKLKRISPKDRFPNFAM